ncbi:MAG: hypothetical protein LBM13_00920 [Candidatus Ancillula sp.]|jgi:hypothetical protein|nr:hypothetical protein [Candidatus Ancillula sp.]
MELGFGLLQDPRKLDKKQIQKIAIIGLCFIVCIAFVIAFLVPSKLWGAQEQNEKNMRDKLANSINSDQYPNGMFDFLTAKVSADEGQTIQFDIVRRGNTENSASVDLKAIDITSKYGEASLGGDFWIEQMPDTVQDSNDSIEFQSKIKKSDENKGVKADDSSVEDSKSMVQETAEASEKQPYTVGDNVDQLSTADKNKLVEQYLDDGNSSKTSETQNIGSDNNNDSQTKEASSGNDFNQAVAKDGTVTLPYSGKDSVSSLPLLGNTQMVKTNKKDAAVNGVEKPTDLAKFAKAMTGNESQQRDWKSADSNTQKKLAKTYQKQYQAMPGAIVHLNFAAGQYIKKLRFHIEKDKISEDDEQALLALLNPVGCATSDNPTGELVIKDKNDSENSTYSFQNSDYLSKANDQYATVTVERKDGLDKFSSVAISSASGAGENGAKSGENYRQFQETIDFVPGQKTKQVQIPVTHPSTEAKYFNVELGSVNDSKISGQNSAQIVLAAANGSEKLTASTGDDFSNKEASDPWKARQAWSYGTSSCGGYGACGWLNSSQRSDMSKMGLLHVKAKGTSMVRHSKYKFPFSKTVWWTPGGCHYLKIGSTEKKCSTLWWGNTETWEEKMNTFDSHATSFEVGLHGNSDKHDSTFWDYHLYYMPMLVNIGDKKRSDGDSQQRTKTWTSATTYYYDKNDSTKIIGSLKFSGQNENTRSNYYYNDDNVSFDALYESSLNKNWQNATYLWGVKVQTVAGSKQSFYYIPSTSFKVWDLYSGNIRDVYGNKIPSKLVTQNTNGIPTFNIYPVYKQRIANVRIEVDNSKVTAAAGTFGKGNVTGGQIGQMDKIKLNIVPAKNSPWAVAAWEIYGRNFNDHYPTVNSKENGEWTYSHCLTRKANDKACASVYNTTSGKVKDGDRLDAGYGAWYPWQEIESPWNSVNGVFAGVSGTYNPNWSSGTPTPGTVTFQPQVDGPRSFLVIRAKYQKPYISMEANPQSGNMSDQAKVGIQLPKYLGKQTAEVDDKSWTETKTKTVRDPDKCVTKTETVKRKWWELWKPKTYQVQTKVCTPQSHQEKYTVKHDNYKTTPLKLESYQINQEYDFISGFKKDVKDPDNYQIRWYDMSGDENKDGILDNAERTALGNASSALKLQHSVIAENLPYVPRFGGNHQLYYEVKLKSANKDKKLRHISGHLVYKGASVIDKDKNASNLTQKNLANIKVICDGQVGQTDANGYFDFSSAAWDTGDDHLVTVEYGGKTYQYLVEINVSAGDLAINEYNTFDVSGFTAQRKSSDTKTYTDLKPGQIYNEDTDHTYSVKVTTGVNGIVANKVIFRHYDSNGDVKGTHEASAQGGNVWSATWNPASDGTGAGDYLTVQVEDQNGTASVEHQIGFTYIGKLAAISLINSFKSPLNPVIDFLGSIDSAFDLGLVQKLDDKIEDKLKAQNAIIDQTLPLKNSNGDVVNLDGKDLEYNQRVITLGFTKDFSGDLAKKDETATDEVLNEAKTASNASSDAEKAKSKTTVQNDSKKAVDKNNTDTQRTAKVSGSYSATMGVAFSLTMKTDPLDCGTSVSQKNNGCNHYYFDSFTITGTVSAAADKKITYTTPIAVQIFAQLSFQGNINAVLGIEKYQNKYYFPKDENDTTFPKIDLTKAGISDVNREYDFYGKLYVLPTIKITVGAQVDFLAKVALDGQAAFDMEFSTSGEGAGNVELSSNLTLTLLGGLITKSWKVVDKKYDLFSTNGGKVGDAINSVAGDEDYRYKKVTTADASNRDYLKNRSGWGNNNLVSAEINDGARKLGATAARKLASGADISGDDTLETGAYPSADPWIFNTGTDKDGNSNSQVMFFLDDNGSKDNLNHTQVMFSKATYNVGSKPNWSTPEKVDSDSTPDDSVSATDLGNGKIAVTWASSNQNYTEGQAPADMLNSRNIKMRLFDKATQTFGPVFAVTHTTDWDSYSNESPSLYVYDGTRIGNSHQIVVSYIKASYASTTSDKDSSAYVGDMLNPTETEMVYRIYDMDMGRFLTFNDISGADTEYCGNFADQGYNSVHDCMTDWDNNWYGQFGFDSQEYTDSNNVVHQMPKARAMEQQVITDPLLSGNLYIATVVDVDGDLSTTDDRQILVEWNYANYDDNGVTSVTYVAPHLLTNNTKNNHNIYFSTDENNQINLYYLSDGNIQSVNFSNMAAIFAGTEDADKNANTNLGINAITVYQHPDNQPVTEFDIKKHGNDLYLGYVQQGLTYKAGVTKDSEEAKDVKNQFAEKQIYLIKQSSNSWSKPVQVTDDQGGNYTDISLARTSSNNLRIAYLKGESSIQKIGDKQTVAEDQNNRSLKVTDYNMNTEKVSLSLDQNVLNQTNSGDSKASALVNVKNESLKTISNLKIGLFLISPKGKETQAGSKTISSIEGGVTESVGINYSAPADLNGYSIQARVISGAKTVSEKALEQSFGLSASGNKLGGPQEGIYLADQDADGNTTGSDVVKLKVNPAMEIETVNQTIVDRSTVDFSVDVKSLSYKDIKGQKLEVRQDDQKGKVIATSKAAKVPALSTATFSFSAKVPESLYKEKTNDDGSVSEVAIVTIYIDANTFKQITIERKANSDYVTLDKETTKMFPPAVMSSISLHPGKSKNLGQSNNVNGKTLFYLPAYTKLPKTEKGKEKDQKASGVVEFAAVASLPKVSISDLGDIDHLMTLKLMKQAAVGINMEDRVATDEVQPLDVSYKYTSSNPDIADVSGGVLTAKKAGDVTIKVQSYYNSHPQLSNVQPDNTTSTIEEDQFLTLPSKYINTTYIKIHIPASPSETAHKAIHKLAHSGWGFLVLLLLAFGLLAGYEVSKKRAKRSNKHFA